MRSSSSSSRPPQPQKANGFTLGPIIYNDNTDPATAARSPHATDYAPTPLLSPRSPDASTRSTASKKSKKSVLKKATPTRTSPSPRSPGSSTRSTSSKKSKSSLKKVADSPRSPDTSTRSTSSKASKKSLLKKVTDALRAKSKKYSKEAVTSPGGQSPRRKKSDSERQKRVKILELAKQAEQDHDKLMLQRVRAEQAAKEIESSMGMEQDARNRSMTMMKHQLEGMDRRSMRDLKDVRQEIEEWKGKTAKSGELAKRVDSVEKRVEELEKVSTERKQTIDMVKQNWADFNRLKTQSMALEVTQIKNRRGAKHLERMPKEVATATSNNLYKLCADLQRLSFHLNDKTDVTRLVDEALTLAEVIAPLFGSKEDFVDPRETTSYTVSIASPGPATETSATSPTQSSARAPIRKNLRRVGRDPATVIIPPLSKYAKMYKSSDNVHIEVPSLREPAASYYSDNEFPGIINNKPVPPVAPVGSTVVPPPAPTLPAAAAAAPSAGPCPASNSSSVDSDSYERVEEKEKKKKWARSSSKERKPDEANILPVGSTVVPPATPTLPAAATAAPLPCPASNSSSVDSDSYERVEEKEKKKKWARRSTEERKPDEAKPQ